MAIHLDHEHGKLVQRKGLICPYCLRLQETRVPEPQTFTCGYCAESFPTRHGIEIGEIGFNISYFGWFYGIANPAEEQLAKKERRKPRKFRLVEPIEFLQLLAFWTAAGIVGNLGYDLIKAGAIRLYRQYRGRKVRRSELSGQIIAPHEAIRQLPRLHEMTRQYIEEEHYGNPSILIELERSYRIANKLTRHKRTEKRRGAGRATRKKRP